MRQCEVTGFTPELFLRKVIDALANHELGKIVSFQLLDGTLTVTIKKLGTSRVMYRVQQWTDGFRATLHSEKIAMSHRPLRSNIEGELARTMERLGARVTR